MKEDFWQREESYSAGTDIVLRKVQHKDKESFLELQKENAIIKSILQEETYCDMLWDEHIEDKALMFSIEWFTSAAIEVCS